MTKGALLLSQALERLGVKPRDAAKGLRVHEATVGRWLSGESRPRDTQKLALRRTYGIDANAWLEEVAA